MGRLYEALEWAEKEQEGIVREISPLHVKISGLGIPKWATTGRAAEYYEALKTSVLTRYPNGSTKTILFAGCAHGNGVSMTAINFGTALARDSRFSVLLLDVNFRTPSFSHLFRLNGAQGLSDLLSSHDGPVSLVKIGAGNLHVLPSGKCDSEPVALLESQRFGEFLATMRERFDYVILDAPPVHGFPESLALASKVDGVILVLNAGKTRQQVALRAKMQLEAAGGKLLGTVLNRREYPIPQFIYKRL
jgi:protein-tyrosine kinase